MKSKPAFSEIQLSPNYFRLLLRRFGSTPKLREAILDGTGVSEHSLEDSECLLTLDQQLRQQDNLHRLLGQGWAVSASDLWGHSTFGLLAVANQSAPNLHQALATIVDMRAASGNIWEYSIAKGRQVSSFHYDLCLDLREDHWRSALEIGFMGLQSLFQLYLTRPPSEMVFKFSCSRPDYAARLAEVLGAEVTFDAPRNLVEFPTAWLERKSPFDDPITYQLACSRLEAQNAALSASSAFRARVERLLRAASDAGATQPEVASALGVSIRTLVRRLESEGVSFRELLEAERCRRATELMRLDALKMAEIAARLGYSDPASFARARRRWANSERP